MNKELTGSHPNVASDGSNNLISYWKFDESSGTNADDFADDISSATEDDGTLYYMDDNDWVTSTAAIGDESIFALGNADISEKAGCMIDVDLTDEGTSYSYTAIQVNETPNATGGLLTNYPSKYWEIWASDVDFDGTFSATVDLHYDEIGGIGDEENLFLYRRDDANDTSWEGVSVTRFDEGNNSDGNGYMRVAITQDTAGDFSGQYIITSADPQNPVPELPTIILMSIGLVGVGGYVWFKRRKTFSAKHS